MCLKMSGIWQNQKAFLLPEFKSANDLPILAAALLCQETNAWENSDHAVNDFDVWFKLPEVEQTETAHFIVKVTDKGTPALTRYARVIVTIVP